MANSSSTSLQLNGFGLQYQGATTPTYRDINLTLLPQGWTCVLGKSGCGKTSLLRQVAGLIEPEHQQQGQLLDTSGKPFTGNIAYMAQQDLLFPWLNVLDNVCLKAKLAHGQANPEDKQRALALLAQVGLADAAEQRPDQLSGGMRQRVALARTLMQDAPLILMDEPFSALDAVTRHRLQDLAHKTLAGRSVLLITHDPQEALRLGDQIKLFDQQRLTDLPTPESNTPRAVDSQLGEYQHTLLKALQAADNQGGAHD
ncbi:MAG: ABC transporter ATP-binding protein [Pontibacterium sp.]